MAVILISLVLHSYYEMPRGQIHITLTAEHPIMSFKTIEIKMAKRSICVKSGKTPHGKEAMPNGNKVRLFKDGAYYCYCAYVLHISRYSGFLSVMLTNTGIFLRGLKLSGKSKS